MSTHNEQPAGFANPAGAESRESRVDVTNCDREPIHIPGRIQSYGLLLVLQEQNGALMMTQVSENVESLLSVAPRALLGQPLHRLLGVEPAERLQQVLSEGHAGIDDRPLHLFTLNIGRSSWDIATHRGANGEIIVELEPSAQSAASPTPESHTMLRPDYYALIRKAVPCFNQATTVRDLSDAVAVQVQKVSGYDRVMVYRFDADGHGSVIAEACRPGLTPFLGLHYPASDIPQQARRLYVLNPLRIIADVEAASAALVPALSPASSAPLDMSQCILRSPSPIHIEYLKNMGVKATLTISLVENGSLWGLVACHHYSPRIVSYEVRTACEFIGQMTSLQLAGKQEGEDREYQLQMQEVQAQLVVAMAQAERYQTGLAGLSPPAAATVPEEKSVTVLDFVDCTGAAILVDGECLRLGQTPPEALLRSLTAWLSENVKDDIWTTDSLSTLFPSSAPFVKMASGLLAMAITRQPDNYVLWFRPEVVQTVDWAGDPNKAITTAEDGTSRISPRESFALWKGIVRGKSLPWRPVERSAAGSLRQAIVEVVLKKAEQMANLNVRLARSNRELDDFAYIASHDLKEPLRGIHNYAHFLLEDYADQLDAEGREKLTTLNRLSGRMEGLIDSLLSYSRFGRMELERQACDLGLILANVQEDLLVRLREAGAQIRVPRPLPTVMGDPLQISALLANLISNAAKYSDKPPGERWIEVGFKDAASRETDGIPPIFYVRDNGIGIRDRHFDSIFRLFKRLHGRDAYGGGAGAGLSIARKIAERHDGKLWLESVVGEGTTFYFTLASEPEPID